MLADLNPAMRWTDYIDFFNAAYVRNKTTNSRVIQAPPLARILKERASSFLSSVCDTPASQGAAAQSLADTGLAESTLVKAATYPRAIAPAPAPAALIGANKLEYAY